MGTLNEQLKGAIEDLNKTRQAYAEGLKKHHEEMEERGKVTQETFEHVKGLEEKYEKAFKSLNERIDKLDRDDAQKGIFDADGNQLKSIGQQAIESEVYGKEFRGKSEVIRVKARDIRESMRKDLSFGTAGAGAISPEIQLQEIFGNPRRRIRMRDIVPTRVLTQRTGNLIQFPRENRFWRLESALTANVVATDTVIPVTNARQFVPGSSFYIGGEELEILSVQEGANTITLTAGLAGGHTSGDKVFAGDFKYTPETALKPLLDPEFVEATTKIVTLAAGVNVTKQFWENSELLRSYIDLRLPLALLDQEDRALLRGDGNDDPQGFMSDANVTDVTVYPAYVTQDTDRVRHAQSLVQTYEMEPEVTLLHPQDWARLEVQRSTNDQHLNHPVLYDAAGNPRLYMTAVVPMSAMEIGKYLTGAFSVGSTLWVRDEIEIMVFDQHSDFAAKNMLYVRAEMEEAHTIYLPKAYAQGEFA